MDILLPFERKLTKGIFVKRYKRFLMDVKRSNGQIETVHCANSGSMKSCLEDGAALYTLKSTNPDRKLPHTLEIMKLKDGLACLNTGRANFLLNALFESFFNNANELNFDGFEQFKKDFSSYEVFKKEAKYSDKTRFDFLLTKKSKKLWLEVKSVSLLQDEGSYAFPDSPTTRGQKHLKELMEAKENGQNSCLVFSVMRGMDIPPEEISRNFKPAAAIDPVYAELLSLAHKSGVQIRVLVSSISSKGLGVRGYFKYKP